MKDREPLIEIAKNSKGRWEWVLWGKGNKPLAKSPMSYARRNEMITTIELVRAQFATARVAVYIRTPEDAVDDEGAEE